jgi:hypothetical protein
MAVCNDTYMALSESYDKLKIELQNQAAVIAKCKDFVSMASDPYEDHGIIIRRAKELETAIKEMEKGK